MEISSFRPKGSVLTVKQVETWREKVKKYSTAFNSSIREALFDFDLLNKLKKQGSYDKFITPMWKEHLDQIEELLLKKDISILDNRLVRYAIYLTVSSEWADKEISYLENKLPIHMLKEFLRESPALNQTIINPYYQTSESRVNHLTHLTFFEEMTQAKIKDMQIIVEFGGGYGGMTALLKMYNPSNTIIVIDVPVMITLQAYYIRNTLGENSFHILIAENLTIEKGKINYIPISLVQFLSKDLKADLFIATWSLSESNKNTQNLIEKMEFLGADHILYGYRFYEEKNPRQPNSAPTTKMYTYDIKFHGPTFWCLSEEQYYLLV